MWHQQKWMGGRGGQFVQICVSRMEKKREKRLKRESWKSQLGGAMSFPAHQPICVTHVVMISSPLAPAAALTAAYHQEVGQKPNFVSILPWPHRGPYPVWEWESVWTVAVSPHPSHTELGWAGWLPQGPSTAAREKKHVFSHSDCPWRCPSPSACCRGNLRELVA